ncbi:acyl-CoA thioesterase [Oleiagrimonas soli]|uniref:Acyl-CoA thioester hydrolase n=1 Tax=Oleiagrimonas soli TaxID=1543381 RepID=A0A099CWA6_9GAMM|nr:thioesterase family protein [Oleiagrimonas soli]KGI77922.1 thioesterase [Oleiagrimonas soli]MBB6183710.1 acyl-CoA thioester hydrolase [Oleiagrimonas soli]
MTDATPAPLFTAPIEVRWRDLDAFNHVNNAMYLTYLEQARLDWLQHLPDDWMDAHAKPVMAASELNYRAPIHWPAQVEVQLFCERLGNSSMTLGHRIVDGKDGRLYCDGRVTLVWIDPAKGTSVALPAAIREAVDNAR